MPSRHKTSRCVCVNCCDNNPDVVCTGRDILLSERTAHLLRAKREEALRSGASLMGTSIPLDIPPKESLSSSPPMLPTLPGDCYLESSSSRFATHIEKREKNHLTRRAHATLDVVERRANELLNQLATVDNSAGVQAVEEDVAVIRSAFKSVKRRVATIDFRREKISRLFTQIDTCLPELCARYPPSIDGPLVYSTGKFNFYHTVTY
jgi:hypothetical protein